MSGGANHWMGDDDEHDGFVRKAGKPRVPPLAEVIRMVRRESEAALLQAQAAFGERGLQRLPPLPRQVPEPRRPGAPPERADGAPGGGSA